MSVLFKSTGRGNDEDDENQLRAALDTVIRRIGEPGTTRRRMERHEGGATVAPASLERRVQYPTTRRGGRWHRQSGVGLVERGVTRARPGKRRRFTFLV